VAKSVDGLAHDEFNGRPLNEERNDAAGAFGRNPEGTGLSGRMAALRQLAVE
jgi:proline racemase